MDFVFDTRPLDSPFVERIWHTSSKQAGSFTSAAGSNWELVIATWDGKTTITARGPETSASEADFPAGADFFGITFKLGAFMPHLPIQSLLNRHDLSLPEVSRNAFWLHGAAWELPTFENADVFINRLIRQEILVRDPLVEAALQGDRPPLSPRSLQYRFVQATGLSYKMIQQIERAHSAAALLAQGTSIADTVFALGYFDQAHLTHSLKRFIGKTPGQIIPKG
jgi:AraC-like DNA-binding protein